MKHYLAFVLVLSACASDPLEPGAGDQAGTGTNSLRVDGRATAEPRTPNASSPRDFDTHFEISLRLGDTPIQTGSVTITSGLGRVDLAFRTINNNNGHWSGMMAGYDEVYRLDVISGADEIRGVIVDGPDVHVFVKPTAGASLDSTSMHEVTWSRDESAEHTTIEADRLDRLTIVDTGSYMLPVGALDAHKDQPRENEIELRRINHTAPAGAIAGSVFEVEVRQTIAVVAPPNPAL